MRCRDARQTAKRCFAVPFMVSAPYDRTLGSPRSVLAHVCMYLQYWFCYSSLPFPSRSIFLTFILHHLLKNFIHKVVLIQPL